MKKLIVYGLIALAMGGCVGQPYNQGVGGWAFRQRGVFVQITHTCTDVGKLYQSGYGLVREIVGATPHGVQLDPLGYDQRIEVTFQSLDKEGRVVATYSESFSTRSDIAETWVISNASHSAGGGKSARCLRIR